ncbi:hypothetical protein [Chitinophaga defluvii]|uniref:GIY-YIG domain-containing protein n=1 Tax=Chitinophaga defluvii TaxID=3163343 RepID=A0ABV2T8U7_9BACT
MFDELKKYKNTGAFNFKTSESLKEKCNAPIDKGGVYLIYKIVGDKEVLIYIGSSGQRNKDGTLKIRKGGMKDRLVNGYHPHRFGEIKRIKRHEAFPQQMQAANITELKFYWWVTYDDINSDFPTDVEAKLSKKYFEKFQKHPEWHKF